MKKILFGIAMMLLMVPVGFCQDQSLQLIVKTDKEVYKVGDIIEFTLSLKNTGREDIYSYVDDYYNAELFVITDDRGLTQEWKITGMGDVMWSKDDYKLIKAGKDFTWTVKARIVQDKGLILDFKDSLVKLTGPGKFEIVGKYQGWDGITTDETGRQIRISKKFGWKNVFLGSLASNSIAINIAEN